MFAHLKPPSITLKHAPTPPQAPPKRRIPPSATAPWENRAWGTSEFPHLITRIPSERPSDRATERPSEGYSASLNATFDSTTSTLFYVDVHLSRAGKTSSPIFAFPYPGTMETISVTLSGSRTIKVERLAQPAQEGISYDTASSGTPVGGMQEVKPGNAWTITSGDCPAGDKVGYRVDATGTLGLEHFQTSGEKLVSVC